MLNLREIHKPKTIEEAIQLLKQPDTVAMAGGTELLSSKRKDVRAVVDLSELGLAYIREQDGAVAVGAMTKLADVVANERLRAAANGVVAQAARRTHANLLRNQATVAGTLISEPDGILALALVALDARVMCLPPPQSPPRSTGEGEGGGVALCDFLPMRDHFTMCGIVTEVVIPAASLNRRAVIESVARTPRDKPIVSVCAAVELENGVVRAAAIALGGVGEVAVRASEAEKLLVSRGLGDGEIERAAEKATSRLNPPSDFRGSAEYRREMVRVLTARALKGIASNVSK